MSDNSKSLYKFGGTTAIISGLLMIFLGYWFIFQSNTKSEAMHGAGVVMTLLLVPTVLATTILLLKDAKYGTLLGVGFATLWIVIELLAHSSQTAPLKEIKELIPSSEDQDLKTAIKSAGLDLAFVWLALAETFTRLGGFLYSVSAIFYSTALRKWGNAISANLFFISAIVFVLTFIPGIHFYWHLPIRGITFIFLGGVLLQAPSDNVEEVWKS